MVGEFTADFEVDMSDLPDQPLPDITFSSIDLATNDSVSPGMSLAVGHEPVHFAANNSVSPGVSPTVGHELVKLAANNSVTPGMSPTVGCELGSDGSTRWTRMDSVILPLGCYGNAVFH